MKVIWMGNIILPAIAEKESLPPVYIVGWLVGLSRRLTQLPDVALTYVFDAPKALTGEVDGYRYYGLVNPTRPTQRCGKAYTRQLEEILRKEQPDRKESLRGIRSEGMILCASDVQDKTLKLVTVEPGVEDGADIR